MVLWKSLLALKRKEMPALSMIKQKGNEEWQQKLKTFKEISQKVEKDQWSKPSLTVVVSFKESSEKLYKIIWNQNH